MGVWGGWGLGAENRREQVFVLPFSKLFFHFPKTQLHFQPPNDNSSVQLALLLQHIFLLSFSVLYILQKV